ncbi:TIGR00730 family Rossman fold protein [Pseudonocardia sp. RS11V-5]|uniref:LOG family protein n=1 Tax=Pseudonocardia terrae TaxID=2905831 RepID=UPI001E2FA1F0|nr:TIGR00730 family Rossman fold protein [Pseudonocardia terrae]MCE3554156.1 TIGR00730 family Rossman fold protein [Pseudonocardia terrae]
MTVDGTAIGRGGRDPHAVCVYCGSSDGVPQRYLDLAAKTGTAIAARGWMLVSGGGRRSMMGAVALAARAGGARTVGVIPRSMVEREWADHDSDELLVTETMRERKALMEAHAGAFLALPGGLGTCEELFEVWTAGSLDLHGKPVVVLDPDGHWSGLLDWVSGLVESGFAGRAPVERLVVARTVDEALDACAPAPAALHGVSVSRSQA